MTELHYVDDDRIAKLVADLPPSVDTRERRTSIAVSVAILRTADPTTHGHRYSSLMSIWNNWIKRGVTDPAKIFYEFGTYSRACRQIDADIVDEVARHIEASTADLLDGGELARQWRTLAAALRGAP